MSRTPAAEESAAATLAALATFTEGAPAAAPDPAPRPKPKRIALRLAGSRTVVRELSVEHAERLAARAPTSWGLAMSALVEGMHKDPALKGRIQEIVSNTGLTEVQKMAAIRRLTQEQQAAPAPAPAPAPEPVRAPEPEPVAAPAPEPDPPPKPAEAEMSRQEWVEKTYPQHPPEVQRVIVQHGYGDADKHEPSWQPPPRPADPQPVSPGFDPVQPPGFLLTATHPYAGQALIAKARAQLEEECKKRAVSGDVEKDAATLDTKVLATRYKGILLDTLRKVQCPLDRLQPGQAIVWWMQQIENEMVLREIKPDRTRFRRRFSQEWVDYMIEQGIGLRVQFFYELHSGVSLPKHLRPVQVEVWKRLRTKHRNDRTLAATLQSTWDRRYAAQQAIHDVWSRKQTLENTLTKLREIRALWTKQQSLLDDSEKSLGPEASLWSSPGEGSGYAELVAQQVEARRQKALDGTGVVVNARGAWMRCRDLAEREIKASDERQERIKGRLEEVELVKRFLEKEYESTRKGRLPIDGLAGSLDESKDDPSSVADVKAFQVEVETRCAKLGALQGRVPTKLAELQGCFESARKHGAVLHTVRSLARSELYNLDHNEEDDVVFDRERTLEERNREGFANAIVLSSDDEDEAPPAKKAKPEPAPAMVVEV